MHIAEQSHWWYTGMASITRALIEKYVPTGTNLKILDAGSGTGAGMTLLSDYGNVTGFDVSREAIGYCRKKHPDRLVQASIMFLPFIDNTFDLATSFDVLYFEGIDDTLALRELSRVLVPGGKMVLRVPAFDWLRGTHDVKVSTGHRYNMMELSKKMKYNGFSPVFMSYANCILFPVLLLKRLLERFLPHQTGSDITVNVGFLRKIFERFIILESRMIKIRPMLFGSSIFAVGQKPLDA